MHISINNISFKMCLVFTNTGVKIREKKNNLLRAEEEPTQGVGGRKL